MTRRTFLTGTAAVGAAFLLTKVAPGDAKEKTTTFTILHTNDMHSSFIGMGPASDYTPFALNDDNTRGGGRVWPASLRSGRKPARIRVRCWCLTR